MFGDATAGPIEIDAVLERHLHERVSEHALATNALGTGHGEQRDTERISDLVFDVFGRAAGPRRQHDDLVLADVRNRIDRHGLIAVPAIDQEPDCQQHDQRRFLHTESHEASEHGEPPAVVKCRVACCLSWVHQRWFAAELHLRIDQEIAVGGHRLTVTKELVTSPLF